MISWVMVSKYHAWSAYHASIIQDATDNPNKTLGCLLPMFEKILSQ